eukprot:m.226792 g.226792  ORF g.226792 m.226792 type:complete len:293 (-) comp18805_c0_seq7:8-886(-)
MADSTGNSTAASGSKGRRGKTRGGRGNHTRAAHSGSKSPRTQRRSRGSHVSAGQARGQPPQQAPKAAVDLEPPSPATAAVRSIATHYHDPAAVMAALKSGELPACDVVKACGRFMREAAGVKLVITSLVDEAVNDSQFRRRAVGVLLAVKGLTSDNGKVSALRALLIHLQTRFQAAESQGKVPIALLSTMGELSADKELSNLMPQAVVPQVLGYFKEPLDKWKEADLAAMANLFRSCGAHLFAADSGKQTDLEQTFDGLRDLLVSGVGTLASRSCALYLLELRALGWPESEK